jgi:hypothetical protein
LWRRDGCGEVGRLVKKEAWDLHGLYWSVRVASKKPKTAAFQRLRSTEALSPVPLE